MDKGAVFEKTDIEPKSLSHKAFGSGGRGRVMLLGAPGSGKSTLASELARSLPTQTNVLCLSIDPGSPSFGAPGAVNLGRWSEDRWRLIRAEAICSLDAARFRSPLISAAGKLMRHVGDNDALIIDMPGVYRGAGGAELFWELAGITKADCAIVISGDSAAPPLANELSASGLRIFMAAQAPRASSPSKKRRAAARTALWDKFLEGSSPVEIGALNLPLLGTPPPLVARDAWPGRQIALLDSSGSTLSMGEIISIGPDGAMSARMRPFTGSWASLLTRDARRDAAGLLRTSRPPEHDASRLGAPEMSPEGRRLSGHIPAYPARVGQAAVILLNGVFGDPLLHLRLRDQKRSLLFDLGEAVRLPARIAHQVSDVFLSHAHIDHIGGFLWLLRSRIGLFPPCRIYGPPGLAANIQGLTEGILWDRIAGRGPIFEAAELSAGRMKLFRIQAGQKGAEPVGAKEAEEGVVLSEPAFKIRAVELDHGTPVIAYSFEQPATLNIRKDRLSELALPPGRWLAELKIRILSGDMDAWIAPPGGASRAVKDYAQDLVIRSPGAKLVYATDLGDTPNNREKLVRLARGADLLFLEASFIREDKGQANATWHLTAGACGEIARSAEVKRLAPFHFSRRYERTPERVIAEVKEAFPHILGFGI